MNRTVWFIICTLVGLELICWGLLVPAHLQAVDAKVLELAGLNSPTLVDEGLSLVNLEKTGPAHMLLRVAEQTKTPGRERLASAVAQFEQAHPRLKVWGGAAPYLERAFENSPPTTNLQSHAVTELLVGQKTRDAVMAALRRTRRPGVVEILQTRELTNTVVFSPAASAAGEPLEATICMTALLYQQDDFLPGLRDQVQSLVTTAEHGGAVEPLERVYLDLLGLGKRLNWVQLADLLRVVPDTNTLRQTADLIRMREMSLPVIFSSMHMAEAAGPVLRYFEKNPGTASVDLRFALRAGSGAVRDLLERQQPIHYPTLRDKLVAIRPIGVVYEPLARIASNAPLFGFWLKYGLCLFGALLIARAVTYLSPSLVDEILLNRPFISGPQMVIGLCLLFLILFSTESLVTRAAPATEFPLHVKIPVASAAARAKLPHQLRAMIDKFSAGSLLTFFVLQATIYVFCRMKLAEIRRQTLPSRLKLRLLENEENLFDAGLYFGFVGTVVSLILVSIGIIKPSLMAAYSSTSFGIIFVSILKIFHVRPFRRRLILDAEITERAVQPA